MKNIFEIYLLSDRTLLYNIELYISLFFIYSFAGWFMESVIGYFLYKKEKFINRGFLVGPICPVYGIGVILVTLLLTKYKEDIVALYVLATVICGALEYFTSFIMEKLFNARWWDYHDRKFNINGRICLETLLPFGIGASLILYIFNPMILAVLSLIPETAFTIIVLILSIIAIIDFIISLSIISSFKGFVYTAKDNTQEISTKVKEKAEAIEEEIKAQSEEMIMSAESSARHAIRKTIIKGKLYNRKVKFRRKHFAKSINELISNKKQDLENRINKQKLEISNYIELQKEKRDHATQKIIEKGQAYKEKLQSTVDNITGSFKLSSEDFTKYVKEKFGEKSILRKRLVDAFPNIEIKVNPKNIKKKKSKRSTK